MNKLQTHVRYHFNHLPVFCSFCGQEILPADDNQTGETTPCKHTLYIATNEGIEFVSDRVKSQLISRKYTLQDNYGLTEFHYLANGEDERLEPYEFAEALDFPDGLNIELPVGAPSGLTVYVGIAPLPEEGNS